jgi:hypothetical protein
VTNEYKTLFPHKARIVVTRGMQTMWSQTRVIHAQRARKLRRKGKKVYYLATSSTGRAISEWTMRTEVK